MGARPNFMKLAPLAHQLAARPTIRHLIVHTGLLALLPAARRTTGVGTPATIGSLMPS